jgi:diketogulonate reductase-like aldo/keto reductase
MPPTWSRRDALRAARLGASLAALAPARAALAQEARAMDAPIGSLLLRKIPATGEQLPAIGLGSWQTFDVADPAAVQPVLSRFLALGGRVIDSSPMYGRAEGAIGAMLAAIRKADPKAPAPFLATKVWTRGKREGIEQMKRSLALLGAPRLDLMQIHNLVDWKTHLATLREWKAAGTIRYLGVTHYAHSAFDELEQILRTEPIDFIQLPYSAGDRAAEQRLLPSAAERGVAVLVMEPFGSGALLQQTRGKPLPAVARDLGCASWAQLLLKFIVGHPAVTCPIPATSKVAHVEDNLGALRGPVPTDAQRKQIVAALG